MRKNLGTAERWVRLVAGSLLLGVSLSQTVPPIMGVVLFVAGGFLVANALLARCYLWQWLGISSLASGKRCELDSN